MKDLSRLGRELKNCVIVDNLPSSYKLHPYNGIPIKSWYDDSSDIELSSLSLLLQHLSKVRDVREYIRKFNFGEKLNIEEIESVFRDIDA